VSAIGAISPTFFHHSIDDVLGPRENRFFGEGFKRAKHQLRQISANADTDPVSQTSARVSVSYPTDWSRKADKNQRPHLSTVDVLVIGAQLSEIHLAHALGLSEEQLARAVLQRARIKAGRSPVEDDLADFPAVAQVVATAPSDHVAGLFVSTVDCVVGTLRTRCEIRHEAGVSDPFAGLYDSPREVLGDPRPRLFGEGFTTRRQFVEDIELDPQTHTTTAAVRVTAEEDAPLPAAGLDSAYHACASPVDAFVIGLQLGQVLLYALDGVSRASSNTLWMRETLLESDPLRAPLPTAASATARLERRKLLENSKAEIWRSADIVGEFHGVRMRCSVAHRLP
jgi:hypothetical protein